eukprot:Gb_00154 [translate_table: standard]
MHTSAGGHEPSYCPLLSVETHPISTLLEPICSKIAHWNSVTGVRFIRPPQHPSGRVNLNSLVSNTALSIQSGWRFYNQFVRLHCERVPIGFASIRVASSQRSDGGDSIERGEEPNGAQTTGGDNAKKVLILMSDTGGGHRASAEAIKAAFQLEFGDEYKRGSKGFDEVPT